MGKLLLLSVVVLISALVGVTLVADDMLTEPPPMAPAEEAEAPPAADPMMEQMAAWAQLAAPGVHHQSLGPFAGSWHVTVTFWMSPGSEPTVNEGTSEVRWVLGGRFLQENFQNTMQMGEHTGTFEGLGLTGYDNAKQQYVGTWSDTMSTSIMMWTGQFDESNNVLTTICEFECPKTSLSTTMRSVSRIVSDDEVLVQMFSTVGDQPEYQCLELAYRRR